MDSMHCLSPSKIQFFSCFLVHSCRNHNKVESMSVLNWVRVQGVSFWNSACAFEFLADLLWWWIAWLRQDGCGGIIVCVLLLFLKPSCWKNTDSGKTTWMYIAVMLQIPLEVVRTGAPQVSQFAPEGCSGLHTKQILFFSWHIDWNQQGSPLHWNRK